MIKRGHVKKNKCYKRGSKLFVVKIAEKFEFKIDWYRSEEIRELVLQYYFVLRSVLKEKPYLRKCLTRCKHCAIFFITHMRNTKRKDLRCPFGCREAHRKKESTKRSIAYYQTHEGKLKRQIQNNKRKEKKDETETNLPEETQKQNQQVEYIQTLTSLIEGFKISRIEIEKMLERVLKQHSIVAKRSFDYIPHYLKKHPP